MISQNSIKNFGNISRGMELDHVISEYIPALRGLYYEYNVIENGKKENSFFNNKKINSVIPYLWLERYWGDFDKIPLKVGQSIKIKLGETVCQKCFKLGDKLYKNLCNDCIDLTDPYQIRLNCMFDREDSYLNTYKKCDKKSPCCSKLDNAKFCHSPYVLYIGRIGEKIKVGITRKSRKGGYPSRFLEQGLNEAISIMKFTNLAEALEHENSFKDIGISDQFHFADKIDQFVKKSEKLDCDIPQLSSSIAELLSEKYPKKQIEHWDLFMDTDMKSYPIRGDCRSIKGEIIYIQGPILLLKNNNQIYYYNLPKLLHKRLLSFSIKGGGYNRLHNFN